MQDTRYPGLFVAGDQASGVAQKAYFLVLAAQLSLFFLVGLLGTTLRLFPVHAQRHVSLAIAVLLSLAILISYIGRERKFDKTWFDARAVAESVKTASWRYMMRSPPFAGGSADDAFLAELEEIRNARSGIEEYLSGRVPGESITDFMRQVRSADFASRKATYLKERAGDQKDWYAGEASWNKRRKTYWYWAVIGLQTAALILAIFTVASGPFAFNGVGVLMTLAASGTAWSQARRHDELSNSYSFAAQEFQRIETLMKYASDDVSFSALVDQAEEAVSREHTMWCARRSIAIPGGRKL